MRRIRIFVDAPLEPGTQAALPEPAVQHVVRVLRLQAGDAIVLFNGDGHDYQARLGATGKRDASAEVLQRVPPAATESPLRITLAQAIARGEKMDWILQKATELGVAAIVPLASERTDVRLDAERAGKRLAHWRGVLESACEQCGRATVPELAPPTPLEHFAAAANGRRWVLDPEAGGSIRAIEPEGVVTIAIGPEGGWSERELELLRVAGFGGLRLGPRVLRTETAGLAAIAALQALRGDLG